MRIDFSNIGDYEDFYSEIAGKQEWAGGFINDLKTFMEEIKKNEHLQLEFINMSVSQLEDFEELLEMLDDLSSELSNFAFTYRLEQFDSE
ncbi:barnase inhibitor [Cruoricaptor ignavus]|uniref:Barnase inhibitor n=1 Tax=Cruoricaptor ignavus TaxID=1118202 RepID=A0A7M1T1R6_9FLAO|nr:barnase inhibitor [Cruoricaptor ignavus]QOR73806.1 barnase inhibitor [Cruoricaptor ignavus]